VPDNRAGAFAYRRQRWSAGFGRPVVSIPLYGGSTSVSHGTPEIAKTSAADAV